jgi:DNA polymerase elongation subunit (family B)
MEIFPYSWNTYEENGSLGIRIFGMNKENESVFVLATGFTPYIYIELPDHIDWPAHRVQYLCTKLDTVVDHGKPVHKIFQKKKKLYYAKKNKNDKGEYVDKTYPFLKCFFPTQSAIRPFIYKLSKPIYIDGIGAIKLKAHEQDANPLLQFMCMRDIKPARWFTFNGGKKIVKEEDRLSVCTHEFEVKWQNFVSVEKNTVSAPLLMGFDIEVNSSNPNVAPRSNVWEDKVFQISCVFLRNGDTKYEKYILSLGKNKKGELIDLVPEKVGEDVEIFMYNTEADLLMGFTELVMEKNPQIITGYNIFSFDLPYMYERAKLVQCLEAFDQISCIIGEHCKEKEISWSSSAFKNQKFTYIDAPGRLWVDMLPIIQRDYKLENYKLKTVSDYFLAGETKDPLSVKGIFKCYRMFTPESLSIVAKYCVKDSELVIKLFEKLQVWIGLTEMANTCNTPVFTLFTQGQQIKIFSQVYKKCMADDIVIDKDSFIVNENDHFTGAYVFTPEPGLYDMVVSFDFSSLYPSTIIAYNIDYSTLVLDESIPDEKCNIFDWQDHCGCCIAEGTNISLSCLSTPIENLVENKEKILSWSADKNGSIYSKQLNFYDQGYKECVELILEDGRKIVCTPDHKLLRSDGKWIEAKDFDLNSDKVMISISYPSYNEVDDIKQCNSWEYKINTNFDEFSKLLKGKALYSLKKKSILSNTLLTDSSLEFNRTIRISRLCGLLITDGSIDKNGRCIFFCGHNMDVDMLQEDIFSICGRNLKAVRQKYCWSVSAPVELSYILSSIDRIQKGKKTQKPHLLPDFINENCPVPILREFLGGLFGGDGCTIYLNKNNDDISGISFCNSSEKEHLNTLVDMMTAIKNILKNCFDIDSTITFSERKHIVSVLCVLLISHKDTVKFSEKIGFRYCVHKTQRLNAAVSYINLRNKVGEQMSKTITLSKEISERENIPIVKAVEKAHKIMRENETILNERYSLPSYQAVIDRLKKTRKFSNKKISFRKEYFLGVTDYLKKIEAFSFFESYGVNFEANSLPVFYLRVLSRKNIGIKKVYDIEVDSTHNFIANGIIVHNCHDLSVRKSKPKNIVCGHNRFRFLKEPAGVIPTLLKTLIDARKKANAEMKRLKGLVGSLTGKEKDDMNRMITVFDKRQLAYKVSCNSMYGGMGVKKGYLPFLPGAMCTTARGRESIEKASKFLTENHGAKLIYGDTDSCYISFPQYQEGKFARELDQFCREIEEESTALFPPPMKFAYEEAIYWRYLILSKKRYMALKCDLDGNVSSKIEKRGVLLSRRDNSAYSREVYSKLIMKAFYKAPLQENLLLLNEEFTRLACGNVSVKDLSISKSIGEIKDYKIRPLPEDDEKLKKRLTDLDIFDQDASLQKIKDCFRLYTENIDQFHNLRHRHPLEHLIIEAYINKALPSQVQLAEKMRRRGVRVDAGERLGFCVIQSENGMKDKLFDKIEDIDYFKEYSSIVKIDPLYYTKILINPVDEVLEAVYKKSDICKKYYKVRETYYKVIQQIKELFSLSIVFEDEIKEEEVKEVKEKKKRILKKKE